MKTLSERIKEGLAIRGMKQSDLVERTGINKSSISTYISGAYEPKMKNIHRIAKALNISTEWLLGYDVPIGVDKVELVTNYLSLANRYSTVICSNEAIDEEEVELLKKGIHSIREQLGLERIQLR